jgi:hypothetical protein
MRFGSRKQGMTGLNYIGTPTEGWHTMAETACSALVGTRCR